MSPDDSATLYYLEVHNAQGPTVGVTGADFQPMAGGYAYELPKGGPRSRVWSLAACLSDESIFDYLYLRAWVRIRGAWARKTVLIVDYGDYYHVFLTAASLAADETVVKMSEAFPLRDETGGLTEFAVRISENYAWYWVHGRRARWLEARWPQLEGFFDTLRDENEKELVQIWAADCCRKPEPGSPRGCSPGKCEVIHLRGKKHRRDSRNRRR